MGITKFGQYMRILRIKNNLLMKDTANELNVKTPFLSAVENGKRKYRLIGMKNYVLFMICQVRNKKS